MDALQQELIDESMRVVSLLQDESTRNYVMAQLDSVESDISQMKENVYSYMAKSNSKVDETPFKGKSYDWVPSAATEPKVLISDNMNRELGENEASPFRANLKETVYETRLAALDAEISKAKAEKEAIETEKMLADLKLNLLVDCIEDYGTFTCQQCA